MPLGLDCPILNQVLQEHTRGIPGKVVQVKNLPRDLSLNELMQWQKKDPSPKYIWEAAVKVWGKEGHLQGVYFIIKERVLYRQDPGTQGEPGSLQMLAGHLGVDSTLNSILQCFYWPDVRVKVQCYC